MLLTTFIWWTGVLPISPYSVTFHQTVRRDDAVLVAGDIQIACIDRGTDRPTRLDADLRKKIEATLAATEEVT